MDFFTFLILALINSVTCSENKNYNFKVGHELTAKTLKCFGNISLSKCLISAFTSSSGTCAPAAAPLDDAAAGRAAPGRRSGAAVGSKHRTGGSGLTWASPPRPALWSGHRPSHPVPEPGWRPGGPAAAPAGCAPPELASSCSGGSGTRSSPGSGWGGSARPGAPSPAQTGTAAAGSDAPARTSAPWRTARAASCRGSSALRRQERHARHSGTRPKRALEIWARYGTLEADHVLRGDITSNLITLCVLITLKTPQNQTEDFKQPKLQVITTTRRRLTFLCFTTQNN